MDTEFPRGRGGLSRKSMEIPGGGGSTMEPPGTENPEGWGSYWKKPSVGGMDIFWIHTMCFLMLKQTDTIELCMFEVRSIQAANSKSSSFPRNPLMSCGSFAKHCCHQSLESEN